MNTFASDPGQDDDCELVFDEELLSDEVTRLTERAELTLSEQPTSAARLPRVGEVVAGKYRIERVPRRSALGVTVEAIHKRLGERVAIKLLLADPRVYPEAVARFLRGARSAVQIRSEHVARVTDVGVLDSGSPYMVTEYLRGSDLDGVLRVRERLQVPEAVDYVLQAGEALAEAHQLGIVHRNLKLSNLFLTRRSDGTALIKVLDFCVSEDPFTDSAINMSGTAGMARSLACLAPEQIREPQHVDARADIWALGAILYQLLTGVPVFQAETTPGLLAMIAADTPLPPTSLCPEVPSSLESVILRCLAKDPFVRYAAIGDLAADLEYFASSDGQGSVERIARASARGPRSTRPPPLPSSAPPAGMRAIVRVASQPPAAASAAPAARRALPQLAFTAVGFGLAAAFGAYVGVRAMQSALGLDTVTAQHPLVASLSPAVAGPSQAAASAAPVAAPLASVPQAPLVPVAPPVARAAALLAAAVPVAQPALAPVAAAPVAFAQTAPVAVAPPARPAARPARPAQAPAEAARADASNSDVKSRPAQSAVADAKPIAESRKRDLFDDTN